MINILQNYKNFLITVFTCIIIIIIIIAISKKQNIFSTKQDKEYFVEINETNLSNYLKKDLKTIYSVIDFRYTKNNIVYGSILDTDKGNDLFQTESIFIYDELNNKYENYNYIYNKRIMEFYILDEKVYATTISYTENDGEFLWEFVKYNKDFTKETVIKEGIIRNPLHSPIIHFSEEINNVYVTAISENANELTTMIYALHDDELVELTHLIDNKSESNNSIINVDNMIILDEDNIIYLKENDVSQELINYNISSKKEKKLLSLSTKNGKISNLLFKNNIIYFLKNNVKESSICALEIGKDHFQELGSGDLAFGNFILDNDYILFHGREEWCLYSLNDKKIYSIDFPNIYAYPKYLLINNDILFESDANTLYLGKIKLKTAN